MNVGYDARSIIDRKWPRNYNLQQKVKASEKHNDNFTILALPPEINMAGWSDEWMDKKTNKLHLMFATPYGLDTRPPKKRQVQDQGLTSKDLKTNKKLS